MAKPRLLPVDRGWAWWVVIGYFLNLYIVISWIRSGAILLPVFLDKYRQSTAVTTLAFGISELVEAVSHVLISLFLINRFSVRTLTLFGAAANVSAILSLSVSSSGGIALLNVAFGVIGFARGFILNPQVFLLGVYFRKRLSFASSLGNTGTSVATLSAPLLTQLLLTTYGLEGTFLMFAGIAMHSLVASMLFRPTSQYSPYGYDSESESKDNKEGGERERDKAVDDSALQLWLYSSTPLSSSKSSLRTDVEGDDIVIMHAGTEKDCDDEKFIPSSSKPINSTTVHNDNKSDRPTYTYSSNNNKNNNNNNNNDDDDDNDEDKFNKNNDNDDDDDNNNSSNDIPLSPITSSEDSHSQLSQEQRLHLLNPQFSEPEWWDKVNNKANGAQNEYQKHNGHNNGKPADQIKTEQTEIEMTVTVTAWEVMKNPAAVLITLAGIFGTQTQCGNVYMPVLGLENGLDSEQLPWLLTIAGTSDILGKIVFGFMLDRQWFRPVNVACMCLFNAGAVFQLVSFFQGMGLMSLLCFIWGFHAGMIQALLAPIGVEYIGLPSLPHAVSGMFLGNCVLTFVAHLVVGTLTDLTGSFRWGFRFVGLLVLAAAAFLFALHFIKKENIDEERKKKRGVGGGGREKKDKRKNERREKERKGRG